MELGDHTAGAEAGAAILRQRVEVVVHPLHRGDQAGVGVAAGVAVVQAVDVRQQHQQIGGDGGRHRRRQGIVVADDDLIGGDGVVLVEDRQRAQLQQTAEGVVEILLPSAVGNVRRSDKELRHGVVILREQLVVDIHQLALSHGGRRLLGGHIGGTPRQIQLPHAHADGAGRHQNDLMPRVLQVAEHLAQPLHPLDVQAPRGVSQRGGTHLYNDTHTVFSLPARPSRRFLHIIGQRLSNCKGCPGLN